MRLLVVSHPCTTPQNQQLYSTVQKLTGCEVSIVVPSNWIDEYGRQRIVERLPGFDGRLILVPVRRAGNIILHTYRTSFTKLIRTENPDVIYVHQEPYAASTAQVFWGNWRSKPMNGPPRRIGFYSAQNIFKRQPPPFRWAESWVLRTSDFAFPCSSTVNDVLKRKRFRGEGVVLPLPIDPAVHHPISDISARREMLGNAEDRGQIILGYLGRFVPEKGLSTLIEALTHLRDLNWCLTLIGTGPMEATLRQQAEAAGIADQVRFTGFVPHDQVSRLLSAMDVLVLPSESQPNWKEQFGRVLLEAMACGTPVVGTDCGEIPVLIQQTGGGLIARERDPIDLAAALRRVIVDQELRERLAQDGQTAVASKYTMSDIAEQFARTIGLAPAHASQADVS